MNFKKCCICEEELPCTSEFFHRRLSSKDGFRCDCKECRKYKKLKDYNKPFKKCSKCNVEKPNTDEYFNIRNKGVRQRNRSMCKECHMLASKSNHLMKKYSLTIQDYEKMYDSQEGKCTICNEKKDSLVIDHCHTTGEVRSLLCNACNVSIGLLKESSLILFNAALYVNKRKIREYRPFSYEEIMDIMNKREINFVDHHTSSTN